MSIIVECLNRWTVMSNMYVIIHQHNWLNRIATPITGFADCNTLFTNGTIPWYWTCMPSIHRKCYAFLDTSVEYAWKQRQETNLSILFHFDQLASILLLLLLLLLWSFRWSTWIQNSLNYHWWQISSRLVIDILKQLVAVYSWTYRRLWVKPWVKHQTKEH